MSKSQLDIIISARDLASSVMSKVGRAIGWLKDKAMSTAGAVGNTLKGAFTVAATGATILGTGIFALGGASIKAAADAETLKASLITAMGGSQKAADAAYKTINTFAAKTPYEMGEVTTAFIKLKNMGLNPSMAALEAYGDTASSMGKGLNDMIEAVADAATGEFERLKEFGIKAKSQGDKVTFTFKGVSKTVGKNSKEIENYLIKLGQTNFGGGMERQSKTLNGMFSTFKDTVSQTLAAFANDTGLLEFVKNSLQLATVWVGQIKPAFDQIRQSPIAGWFMSVALPAIQSFLGEGWNKLLQGINYFSTVIWPLIWPQLQRFGQWFINDALPAIKQFIDVAWKTLQSAFEYFATNLWPNLIKPALDDLMGAWQAISPVLMDLWNIFTKYIAPFLVFLAGVLLVRAMVAFRLLAGVIKMVAGVIAWLWTEGKKSLDNLGKAFNWLKDQGTKAWNGLKDGISSAVQFIKRPIDDLISKFNDFKNAIPSFDSIKSGLSSIKLPSIPGFASGTNFAPGGVALVGEQGPELVNLPRGSQVKTAGETRQALSGQSASGGGSMSQVNNITINLTGGNFASEKDRRKMTDDIGKAMIETLQKLKYNPA